MNKVLLVDDDTLLTDMLGDYLAQEGFIAQTTPSGEQALSLLSQERFDLVVLDVMMPGIGGIETLRKIRVDSAVPVLMLTARGDDMDRIIGLELGADDYVPKPCLPRELLARIRAILRRFAAQTQAQPTQPILIGDLGIWPEQRKVEKAGKTIEVTSTEYNLIEVLARHAGKPVSKSVLSEEALGRPLAKFDRSIDVHLHSIRQKLGNLPDGRSCIQTVYRLGYQLIKA